MLKNAINYVFNSGVVHIMKNIIPITDLQRKAGQIVDTLKDTGESVIITQRGRPAAVLIAADHYARMEEDLARLDELELVEMVAHARDAIEKGETISHAEVSSRMRKSPKRRAR